jgi:serine/threonine-protein kinase HipA
MGRPRTKMVLRLFMNNSQVGTLIKLASGALQFTYDPIWVQSKASIPLSLSLPLTFDTYSGDTVVNYFDNLLPDNDGIRKVLAQRMSLNSRESFDLLAAIGRDCVGAVQLVPFEEEFRPSSKLLSQPISQKNIAKTLRNLKNHPLGIKPNEDFRISIAGAQEKTAFLKIDNEWHVPSASTPSTHIFKVQMGILRQTIDMEKSVENEWLCLQICKEFGLPTANATIEDFDDVRALVIERFDRQLKGKTIRRLAQEDFCQIFGVPSHKKYENEGGPGIVRIMDALTRSDEPMQDKFYFLKSQMVFWLLAAIDGHAKNFSVFLTPEGISLTPLYDVMSAHPPIKKRQIAYQKAKLAMSVGTNRHYRINEIKIRHWMQTAKETKFPQEKIEQILAEITDTTDEVINKIVKRLPKDFPQEISDSIFEGMLLSASKLKTEL